MEKPDNLSIIELQRRIIKNLEEMGKIQKETIMDRDEIIALQKRIMEFGERIIAMTVHDQLDCKVQEDFVPHEQAFAIKELGFNEPCFACYSRNNENAVEYNPDGIPFNHNNSKTRISAPTFSQAFRFFREKYGLFVAPSAISYEGGPHLWFFEINSTTLPLGTDLGVTDDFKTYKEAELACIKKLIETDKNDKKK